MKERSMAHDELVTSRATRTTELDSARHLMSVMAASAPFGSRRDLMRWGAVLAGAAAGAQLASVQAAPAPSARSFAPALQGEEFLSNVELTILWNPFGEVVTLDPHRAPNWGPFWNLFPNVWGGLLRFDENGGVQLDLAESFAVSDDGLSYTFKIRPDAKYASGNTVVANDFLTSWKRALEPANLSPMASFMSLVEGYDAFVAGESEEIGFEATDDQTVVIKLVKPANFFPSYVAAFVWSVVDPAAVEASSSNFPLNDAGTGPWRFTEFESSERIVLEPNTNHYGGNSPSIVRLVWQVVSGQNADADALELYRNDLTPLADVPISLLSTVERDPDLAADLVRIENSGSTRALGMDFNQAPFNDVRVRQALAHACNRDNYANVLWEGTWLPTTTFSPPVLSELAGYQGPEGLAYDANRAAELLDEAGFPGGEGLPELTFFVANEETSDEKSRWQAFFQAIKDESGFPITVDDSLTSEQILNRQQDNGGRQLDAFWWWNVAQTPHLLTDAFHSSSAAMQGVFNWNAELEATDDFDPGADSREFDELVERADTESDRDARNDLFRQAEELVLRNAVASPLGNWVQIYLQKPWLQGTRQGPWTGRLPVWFDKNVVVLPTEEG
jgi:ABC-type transport system substrate-binding protein